MSAVAARRFAQVDVFGAEPFRGNPVAVVVDADGVDDDAMAAFARWTNLSETTFLLRPIDPAADYRLRIFTPEASSPSPATRRSAARTPGWPPGERRGARACWCRSARWASCGCG